MTELDVDPELFYEAAGAYSKASTTASNALSKLDGELRTAVEMTGSDAGGQTWGAKYNFVGLEGTVSASVTTQVLYRMAALIRQSGVNHDQSEEAQEYNTPGGALPDADPGGKTFFARPLKNPAGGNRSEPFGWKIVMPDTEWVNGDTTKLQAAANSWTVLASVYGALDNDVKPKMDKLAVAKTTEMPDITSVNSSVKDAVELLSDAMRQIGSAISGYADVLKAAQEGIEWELQVQTVAQAINTINAATVGRPIQKAIRKAAELEIKYSRGRIETMLTGLATARDVTWGVLDGASTVLTSAVNTKINPVLLLKLQRPPEPTKSETARENRARGARAEARAGIDPTTTKTSIPSATGTAKRRIPDEVDHARKVLTEVKNVNYQEYTDQIKDFEQYAANNKYTFNLVVDNRTQLAPEIQNLVSQGKIVIVRKDLNS
ncbi:putative toxin [Nocardia sp. NPDC005978]|uniref:putative toxin n=1 Tax=Nocardia sp. NPDC005978 TaxID=3156725 RepID=UPI0033B36639